MLEGAWSNEGVIQATDAAVYAGGEFTLAELGVINRTNSPLYLNGTLDNTGSTLVLDSTVLTLYHSAAIKGGTVTANAPFTTPAVSLILNGVTLTGEITLPVGASLALYDGLTISSASKLILSCSLVNVFGTQTIQGPGQLVFEGGVNYPIAVYLNHVDPNNYSLLTHLTLGNQLTVVGRNDAYLYPWNTGFSIINQGIIRAEVNGRIIRIQNPFTNQGQLQELNGGTIVIQ